jgi:hypothetical protein
MLFEELQSAPANAFRPDEISRTAMDKRNYLAFRRPRLMLDQEVGGAETRADPQSCLLSKRIRFHRRELKVVEV